MRSGEFKLLPALAITLAALSIQIATNFANDVIDYERGVDTEDRLGPQRAVQSGEISAAQMKRATRVVMSCALLLGLYLVYLGGWPILLIGVCSLFLALGYSAGPYALSYRGTAEVFVLLFFGPIASCGTEYILRETLSIPSLLLGIGCGAIATALMAINNLRDIESDRRADKRTLAVRFGERFARWEITCLLLLPLLMILLVSRHTEYRAVIFALFYLAPALVQIRLVLSGITGRELNLLLARSGKTLLLYSLLCSLGLLA